MFYQAVTLGYTVVGIFKKHNRQNNDEGAHYCSHLIKDAQRSYAIHPKSHSEAAEEGTGAWLLHSVVSKLILEP